MNHDESVKSAKKYLEDLLSFFEVNADVEASVENDVIKLRVPKTDDSSILIGRGAETLTAFQYAVSTMLRNNNAALVRVNVDIADYKKDKNEKLMETAREWMEAVRSSGDSHVVRLNPADRRIVHQVATEFDDIETFSEGEGRERVIIIAQKSS